MLQGFPGLLVGMVGRSHHGPAGNVGKTQFIAQFTEAIKFIRVYITVQWQMVRAGLQLLSERQHIAVMRAQVAHHLFHFPDCLPDTQHQS